MKSTSRKLGAIAAVLLIPSFIVLGVSLREEWADEKIDARYSIEEDYFNLNPTWRGHSISLSDSARSEDMETKVVLPWGYQERVVPVRITIDGRDFSAPYDVGVRPESKGANRYHHWLAMGQLADRQIGTKQYVIVQRFMTGSENNYRVLRLSEDGVVSEEIFSHSKRIEPLERLFFVRLVYPVGIGVYSNLNTGWPGFYPIVLPFGTFILGGIILICAVIFWFSEFAEKRHGAKTRVDDEVVCRESGDGASSEKPRRNQGMGSKIVIGMSVGAVVLVLGLFFRDLLSFDFAERHVERYIIPAGYTGRLRIYNDIKGTPEIETIDGKHVFEFPKAGVLFTSSSAYEGWKQVEYFERKDDGVLVPLKSDSALDERVGMNERWASLEVGHIFQNGKTMRLLFVGNARDRAAEDADHKRAKIDASMADSIEKHNAGRE